MSFSFNIGFNPKKVGYAPQAPSVVSVTLSPLVATVGDTITASVVRTGRPTPTLEYRWRLDGTLIDGATASSYTTAAAGSLVCEARASNSEGTTDWIASDPAVVAAGATAPSAPTLVSATLYVATPYVPLQTAQRGVVGVRFVVADFDPLTHTLHFVRSSSQPTNPGAVASPAVPVSGVPGEYTGGLHSVTPGNNNPYWLFARNNVTGLWSPASAPVTAGSWSVPQTPSAPSVTGGETLTFTPQQPNNHGTWPRLGHEWEIAAASDTATILLRGFLPSNAPHVVPGLAPGDYVVRTSQVSEGARSSPSAWSSAVTVTAPVAPPAALVSADGAIEADAALDPTATAVTWTLNGVPLGTATLADLALGPVCVRVPVYSGTPTDGNTVTVTSGLWAYLAADGLPSIARSWLRAGEVIPGADTLSRVVSAADGDTTLGLVYRETATNSAGARAEEAEIVPTLFPLPIRFGATPGAPYLLQQSGTLAAMPSTPDAPAYGFVVAARIRLDNSGTSRHIASVTNAITLSRRSSSNDLEFSVLGAWRRDNPDAFTTADGSLFTFRTNNSPVPSGDRQTFLVGETVSFMAVCDMRGGIGGVAANVAGLWWHKAGSTPRWFPSAKTAGSLVDPETHFLRTDLIPVGGQRTATSTAVGNHFSQSEMFSWFWASTEVPGRWQFTDPAAPNYAPGFFFNSDGSVKPLIDADPNGVIDGVAPGIFLYGPPLQWAGGINRAPNGNALNVTNSAAFTLGTV